jgi:glutathione S-transferase
VGVCATPPEDLNRQKEAQMPESHPTLYVCHGDDGGPRVHPCRRVQEALRAKGIEYDKVIAAHGSPIPFLRKGSREELRDATGDTKLPALKLADGTVLTHSKAILSWIEEQDAVRV